MSIPGQPLVATVTITNTATGALFDPYELVFSISAGAFADEAGPTVLRFIHGGAQSPAITQVGVGTYAVAFTPSDDGLWSLTGDYFDSTGTQIGAFTTVTTVTSRPVPIPGA